MKKSLTLNHKNANGKSFIHITFGISKNLIYPVLVSMTSINYKENGELLLPCLLKF